MKVLQAGLILLVTAFVSPNAHAQHIRVLEGNLDKLKGEKSISTEFAYDNLRVGKEKEEDYVESKKKGYNKKEPGRGDNWAKDWVEDRKNKFEPRFNEFLERYNDMKVTPKSKYTLIFKTTFMEPGFNVGVMRKSAYINGEAWIVETANKTNVIAKISVEKAPGRNFWENDFDQGERLVEAYAEAGRALGRFIKDKS